MGSWHRPAGRPVHRRFVLSGEALDWVVAITVGIVPLVFLAGLLRSRLARGGLADLFGTPRDMRPAQLQAALGRAARVAGTASSPRVTRNAAGSNAICTTAPSSGWCFSPCSCH